MGGNNPSGVAKALGEFFKKKDKVEVKAGILDEKALSKEEITALAKLPGLEYFVRNCSVCFTSHWFCPRHQRSTAKHGQRASSQVRKENGED